ncbi:MAG TPA: glycosyltransferase, partial [Nocardioides sp.]|nr:glycosyltransferase [Nocardioides sp.]
GALAGVRTAERPSVSVVMATRRPDLLEHALGQVARQRGVDRLELVYAPHGFEVDPARLAELAGSATVQQIDQPGDVLFGDVLHAATRAASGDVVVKMDDDDWYAPDFLADLLLAREYSGAELVGMPDDVYYLEPTDETVRLGQPSEVYRQFVAGGTILVDRGLLREVGGFRSVRRHVDAELIAAGRAAGGTTYRTHGLGYVLRRTDSGHTWQADLDQLRSRAVETRPGFRPGRLLEL